MTRLYSPLKWVGAMLVGLAFCLFSASPAAAHNDAAYSGWTRGFDFAWDKPSPSQVRDHGGWFVMVYISPTSDSGKHASASQIRAYQAAGVSVGLIYETTAARAKGGCQAGREDAVRVNVALNRLGLPLDSVVYSGAIDFDTYPSIMGTVASYLDCQVSVRGGKDRVGVYGDFDTIEKANGWGYTRLWQTYAWSGGKWSGAADLRQVHNGHRLSGHDTDLNYSADTTAIGLLGDRKPPAPSPGSQRAEQAAGNPYSGFPVVRYGSKGSGCRALQGALYNRGWRLAVDGSCGPKTIATLRRFQADKGLAVDGVCGPATWYALYKAPVT